MRPSLRLALTAVFSLSIASAEIIYDNTRFMLSGFANENREYGDQLDLEGTARTLTELTFYYFGEFTPDGDETMKVRLYANETPYDDYRKAPATLLFESGNIPVNPGYASSTIKDISVRLPLDTVTFTIQFRGLKTNEVAGLLLYGPPTVGSSFNEFWGRTPRGTWQPFIYSTTDFSRRANAAIRLVAEPEPVLSIEQTDSSASIALRDGTSKIRLAQTFTPQVSGRLDRVNLSVNASGAPIYVSVLEAENGRPGPNSLGTHKIATPNPGVASASFYNQAVYLTAGRQYAIEVRMDFAATNAHKLRCSSTDAYDKGQLWFHDEPVGDWEPATLTNGASHVDAAFSLWMVPAAPPVRITSPAIGEVLPFGQSVLITTDLKLPSISTVWRVRFYADDQEIEQDFTAPYEARWTPTTTGAHSLKVTVEDTFRRPFRAEPHTVTVLELPVNGDRVAAIQPGPAGSVSLTFPTVTEERIRVEYSEDLENWVPAAAEAIGTGGELAYPDDGPPKTETHPKDSKQRFYRIRFGN